MTVVPAKLTEYFDTDDIPTVVEQFKAGHGWGESRPYLATRTNLQAARRQGWTSVAVTHAGRTADFRLEELLTIDRRPLLGGNLI